MNLQAIVVFAIKASITLTLFGFGLQATLEDLLYLWRRPRLLFRSLAVMFVVMPLFAIFMTRIFSLDQAVVIALIALSISPVPPLLPKRVTKEAGVAPFGLGLMVTAGTLAIVYIPLANYLIGKYFHKSLEMDPAAVMKIVALRVLIPLAAGIVIRKFALATAERIARPIIRIAGIVLILGVLCITPVVTPIAWSLVGNGTLLAFIAFVIVGLLLGHLLGGPSPDDRVTLALSTACRQPGLALAMASANFPGDRHVVGAILIYVVTNFVFSIPYIGWQRKKLTGHARPAKVS
jgi:BASS family bile acid:Na+ symporter